MATTTNFGWETPDDNDLVSQGAAAMRALGDDIDASLVDLKGGTTDQVLAKNSGTDMDFKWATPARNWVLLDSGSLNGLSTKTISSIDQTYRDLVIVANNASIQVQFGRTNPVTAANTYNHYKLGHPISTYPWSGNSETHISLIGGQCMLTIENYSSDSPAIHAKTYSFAYVYGGGTYTGFRGLGVMAGDNSTKLCDYIDVVKLSTGGGNWGASAMYYIYGVENAL